MTDSHCMRPPQNVMLLLLILPTLSFIGLHAFPIYYLIILVLLHWTTFASLCFSYLIIQQWTPEGSLNIDPKSNPHERHKRHSCNSCTVAACCPVLQCSHVLHRWIHIYSSITSAKVGPTFVAASTAASSFSSSATTSTCPSLEARCRAFRPFWNTRNIFSTLV